MEPYLSFAAEEILVTREHLVLRFTAIFATDVAGHGSLTDTDEERTQADLLVGCQRSLAAGHSGSFSPGLLARGSIPPRMPSGSRNRINMNDDAVEGEKRATGSDVRGAGMGLVRQQTVVLLVDLVESVRLMREHEALTVRRWADFVRIVTAEILPRRRGVLVKSLGDGLMARFEAVPDAVDAAAEMHRTLAARERRYPGRSAFSTSRRRKRRDGMERRARYLRHGCKSSGTAGNAGRPGRDDCQRVRTSGTGGSARQPGESRRDHRKRRRRATSLRMGWMRRAKTSAIAFSSTLTSRFGHTALARQVHTQASAGGATTEDLWSPPSP